MSDAPARVTIREVARDTGLSTSTVSRVLTGARAVSPEVAERVRESAERLGYRADPIGRSLRTRRTDTLGLVIPDVMNPFFPQLVQAVEYAARQRGLAVLIADASNDPEAERAALRTLVDRRVDAVLISPTHLTASRDALTEAAKAVPTIQLDRVIDPELPFVRADQGGPVEAIVRHLEATKRRRLAFIGQRITISTSVERERAFQRLMGEHFPGEPLRVVTAGMSADSGRAAARDILSSWPETDAIICANDLIAVGVLQELGGRAARREVAISGFDDTLLARALHLTSVRQPVERMADAALDLVAARATQAAIELDSEVIFRLSTT